VQDDANGARRAVDRIRAIADEEHVALAWDPARFEPRSANEWESGARTWQVAPDAVFVSDGIPDLSNTHVRISGARATVVIAADAVLRGARIEISSSDAVVFIGPQARLNLVTLSVSGPQCTIVVGSATTWQSGSCLCQWKSRHVILGDDCMLADEVIIRTNDGHGIFDRTSHEKINPAKSVVLEAHVWVGRRSTVNKGARVGMGAIVGSDSVASGSLEGHNLYAGVPAKKVRENVTWSRTHNWDDIPEAFR
jgi:carbonic anhydrase/acetyltransferase-like protein (isoleucine patch superfamily)